MNWKFFHWQSLKARVTLFTLAIFVTSMWALAFYASRMLRGDLERQSGEQQFSTVSFVAAEIDKELEERIQILETVAHSIDQPMLNNPAALQRMLEQNPVIQGHFNAGLLVLSLDGTAVADVPVEAGRRGVNYFDNEADHIALTEGRSAISGPMIGRKLKQPLFNIAAPIRDAQGKVIGAMVGVINLARPNFLDAIGKHRYGKSGGYLVVDPRHRLFVTATDKARVMQAVPAPGVNWLFDRRMQGYYEPEVAVSSLGVENLSSAERIPVAGWFVIAALPTQEAFASVHDLMQRIVVSAILLTLLAGGLTWWMLRRQLAPMLATVKTLTTLSDTTQPPQLLPIASQDEIGDLIGGFNHLLETLAQREDALRASEARSRKLMDISPDGIWIHSEGKIHYVNDAQVRMLGYSSPEELLGRFIYEFFPPDELAALRARVKSTAEKSTPVTTLTKRLCRDGSPFPVEVTAAAYVQDGKPWSIAISRDITERNRAEADLRKLSRAVAQSPSSIVITDREGRIEYVNPHFEKVTGYTSAEAVGQNPRILKSGIIGPEIYRKLWRAISTGGEWRGELCNRRKDGRLFWEYAAISGLKDEDGQVGHYVAVKEDITERKRAESEHAQLAAIVEGSEDAIISRGPDMTVISWNAAAERLFGYAAHEAIGKDIEFIIPEDRMDEVAHSRVLLAEGHPLPPLETVRRAKDGRLINVSIAQSPIRNAVGEMTGVSLIIRDMTERKRLEEAHLRSQKLESLGTLAGGIAHDFNNVLAAIQGNANLAAEDVGPDHAAAESLQEIKKAAARASELVRRIMAFGRPRDAQHQVVDLSAVADEVLKLLRSTLPAGIALNKDFAVDTPQVLADAGQIHEAIVNLTTNAAHAIGARAGTIHYRLEPVEVDDNLAQGIPGLKPGRYARLTVTDSGCGMDAGTMERIFDAFYTTKAVGEGTGLGLSMVHGIMKSHGGAVTVQSTPGEGSSFALYFPAAKDKAKQEEEGAPVQSLRATGQRVLYVDDEEALVFLAKRVLSRLGHSISGFTDPKEALQAFLAHPQNYDILVTDLSMPQMSGFELSRQVLELRPDMPVLMTSGYVRAEDEATARGLGIRRLILKPTTIDELAQVLDSMFRNGENGEP